MKLPKLFFQGLALTLFLTIVPFVFADTTPVTNGEVAYRMVLTGRDMTYQVYLPVNQPNREPYTGSQSQDFNRSTDITPLDHPVRIYWELSVSDCTGGKNVHTPQLVIAPTVPGSSPGGTADAWVNESLYGDTRIGSFILPAGAGMKVSLDTGGWDKRTALFSVHHYAYECRLKLFYRPGDRDLPPTLQHVDANIFNRYIAALIKDRENDVKTALINEKLYDLVFRKVAFQIQTGELLIDFTAYYKSGSMQVQADGTVAFEARMSGDCTRMGLYCKGLVGPFDIPHGMGFLKSWGRNYINGKIADQQYWTGPIGSDANASPFTTGTPAGAGEVPVTYLVFKNENLADIINKAVLAERLRPFDVDFLGGIIKVSFQDLAFQTFDLAEGRAKGSCRLAAELHLLGKDILRLDNAGTAEPIALDFYIDANDQSWWARLNEFHVTLNGISLLWNEMVNRVITQKMTERHGLIPLKLPAALQRKAN